MRTVLPRIDRIPLPSSDPSTATGRLYAAGFSAVGPDPDHSLSEVGADFMVCLLTHHEIDLRYPEYASWLLERSPHDALWLQTDDGDIAEDDHALALVCEVITKLHTGRSVITHCGAGMARTSVVCILTMVGFGADPHQAAVDFRTARPGGGPDGPSQASQIERLVPRVVARWGRVPGGGSR